VDSKKYRGTLLIVEDNLAYRQVLQRSMQNQGFETFATATPEEALALAASKSFDYALLDLNLGGSSGLALIQPLLTLSPQARVVILTGYASIPTTICAIKLGAVHYLAKPADSNAIIKALLDNMIDIPEQIAESTLMSIRTLEWEYIHRVLNENDGNISDTAKALKMHPDAHFKLPHLWPPKLPQAGRLKL
jgi:two-component system response regulator RegA